MGSHLLFRQGRRYAYWFDSLDFGHSLLVRSHGLIPVECSLPRCAIALQRAGRDSNPRPPPWQGGILTNWTTGPKICRELYGGTIGTPFAPCKAFTIQRTLFIGMCDRVWTCIIPFPSGWSTQIYHLLMGLSHFQLRTSLNRQAVSPAGVVSTKGFEPLTVRSVVKCSIQLSYAPCLVVAGNPFSSFQIFGSPK